MTEREESDLAHLEALEMFDAEIGAVAAPYVFPICPICRQINWGHIPTPRFRGGKHWLRCRTDGAEFTQASGERVYRVTHWHSRGPS